MVNERESMSLAHLSLQCEQKTQHQLGAKPHGRTDVTNNDDLWFTRPVAKFELHRHAVIFEIRANRRLWIELPALGAFLAQRDSSAQCGCQSFDFTLQDFFLFIRERMKRTV